MILMAENKTQCKHFNGMQMITCKAGVNYLGLAGGPNFGWSIRLPCISTSLSKVGEQKIVCLSYEQITAAEIAKEEKQFEAGRDRLKKALDAVRPLRKVYKGQDASGVISCPICNGKLHWRIVAYRGHMWGRCETPDCVNWIE